MDNEQYRDTATMHNSLVLYHGPQTTDNDDLDRRLKNRERQRRYRARKRHEADLKKALAVNQSIPLLNQQMPNDFQSIPVKVEISVKVTTPEHLTRVHCCRDWKKDARRASIQKKTEVGSIVSNNSDTAHCGTPTPVSLSDLKADLPSNPSNIPSLDSNSMLRSISCKRHWKVEARNKKNERENVQSA